MAADHAVINGYGHAPHSAELDRSVRRPPEAIPLFRSEAVDAKQTKLLGDIVLIHPLSFGLLTAVAVGLAGLVVAFLVWGTYTKRRTVVGQLTPDSGLIKVYVQQPGVILEKRVSEGQPVKAGDVLYVVSSERRSSTQGDTQAMISKQVKARQRSLRDELANTRQLQKEEQQALAEKVAMLRTELSNIDDQLKGQRTRVHLAQESFARYEELTRRGFIAKEVQQEKQGDVLAQQTQLQSLERNRISVARELHAHQADLNGLGLKHENQLALIERNIASAEQELTESEARRRLVITAPESGTATAVVAEVGQVVDTDRPLASIVPTGAKLQAHLYVPSKAVGFVKPGDAVLLRYQAYPYQKFGHHRGIVATVSRTALVSHELTGAGMPLGGGAGAANEPLYRVTVDLTSQSVDAYGRPQPLQSGMLLDADLLQDTRRLYEWVLEPLYSLSGKL